MSYELRLRAIGRIIDSATLREVCLTEFDHGVLVVGVAAVLTAGELLAEPKSLELDNILIEQTIAELQGTWMGNGTGTDRAKQAFTTGLGETTA